MLSCRHRDFLNPYFQTGPAALSDAEHNRIACSLCLVQIYYQMRVQVATYPSEISCSFPEAFLRELRSWQVGQGRCIDHFVRSYCYEWTNRLHCFANIGPPLLQHLLESYYIIRFRALFEDNTATQKCTPHFSRAAVSVQGSHDCLHSDLHTPEDVASDSMISVMTERFKNYV